MSDYFIKVFEVKNLWGHKNIKLDFNKDVNILIGANASGKTTILNLLRYILTADFFGLSGISFDKIIILLNSFKGSKKRTLKINSTREGFNFVVSNRSFNIPVDPILARRHETFRGRLQLSKPWRELADSLRNLVPAIWLPVSRRLPISEEEGEERIPRGRSRLESVDLRLRELLSELSKYRLTLETQLSERYKEFERRVLEIILYSKSQDKFDSIALTPQTEAQKEQLIRAFEVAGLLDTRMRKRIDDHFVAANEALQRFEKADRKSVQLQDVFIIPLINRMNSMVQFAGELEEDRKRLFLPIQQYESIVNSFLSRKSVKVEENGELKIKSLLPPQQDLNPNMMSSGEKQILILLTQALMWEAKPVVYVVDEPELSLHVKWQEKLLKSLKDLGKEIQIIVATHSPDIVGPFIDKVIDLGS